jgi:Cysteine dioxygenase type I
MTTDLTFTRLERPARLDAPDNGAMLRWAAALVSRSDLTELVPVVERSWIRLPTAHGWDAWLIGWPGGSDTGWHDHQGSAGVIYVARGTLTEFSLAGGVTAGDVRTRRIDATRGRAFGANHVHHVVNEYDEPAYSVHVYAPRLRGMTRYGWKGEVLVSTGADMVAG